MYDYEISLVPDIKAEYLKKRRLQAWIILLCIMIGAACAAVIIVFLGIIGAQAVSISSKDNEVACRVDGSGTGCSKYGTPIKQTRNLNELLTIQDQMSNLDVINQSKYRLSRLFGVLDVLLLEGDYNITADEFEISFEDGVDMNFSAKASSKSLIGFDAVEAFKKSARKVYYDYGSYMRKDEVSGEYVEIPSYCITEVTENNVTYGIYHKYAAGCEAPMVLSDEEESDTPDNSDDENHLSVSDDGEEISFHFSSDNDNEDSEKKEKRKEVQDIKIRRTYADSADLENYKNGKDRFKEKSEDDVYGYYFRSDCIKYSDNGKLDADSTYSECPLLLNGEEDNLTVGESTFSVDDAGNPEVKFDVEMLVSPEVFKAAYRHLTVIGPSKQNVTDSYVQVRDMFSDVELKENR